MSAIQGTVRSQCWSDYEYKLAYLLSAGVFNIRLKRQSMQLVVMDDAFLNNTCIGFFICTQNSNAQQPRCFFRLVSFDSTRN